MGPSKISVENSFRTFFAFIDFREEYKMQMVRRSIETD